MLLETLHADGARLTTSEQKPDCVGLAAKVASKLGHVPGSAHEHGELHLCG
jgi:hypothetical protein